MRSSRRFLAFLLCALTTGVVFLMCERWYELTFGIKYRTLEWWIATMLDGAPVIASIALSGNVHQGSAVGYWAGFVLQWTLLGAIAYGLAAFFRSRKGRRVAR
jgi:hypothetical protein